MVDTIQVISLNVRGLGLVTKIIYIFTWLHKQDISIVMLQETHCTAEIQNQWRAETRGEAYFSNGTSNARGVTTLLKPSISNVEVHEIVRDAGGRSLIMDITVNGLRLTLGNIYGPNIGDPRFVEEMIEQIERLPNDNRLFGGDYNLVLNVDLNKAGGQYKTHKKAQEVLLDWMENTDLMDIWRVQHKQSHQYTYHTKNPTTSCRLDFFLSSFGLMPKIRKSSITHGYLTDHSCIMIIMHTSKERRGPGFGSSYD